MTKSKEVAVLDEQTTQLSTQLVTETANNFESEDYALPFILIAEALSDIVQKHTDKYNPDAGAGDLYNSVTNKAFKSIEFVPGMGKKSFVEWTPEAKGTFIADHKPNSEVVLNAETVIEEKNGRKFIKKMTPAGNQLVETITYSIVYISPDGDIGQALLPFSKTRLAIARNFNTMDKQNIAKHKCLCRYKLSTVPKTNNGNSWHVHKIETLGPVQDSKVVQAVFQLRTIADKIKPAVEKAAETFDAEANIV